MELATQELRALVTSTYERGADLETNGPTRSHVGLGTDIKSLAGVLDSFAATVSDTDTVVLMSRAQYEAERAQYKSERDALCEVLLASLGVGLGATLEVEQLEADVTDITARLTNAEQTVSALNTELLAATTELLAKKSKKSAAKKSAKK